MSDHSRIVRDPTICAGQPIIRGTRVLVRVILGHLAHGEPLDSILCDFPSLTEEDLRAVIAFAAAAAGEDLPAPSPEDLEKLAMEHPVLKQAKDALDRLSADELAQIQAEHREMALLTYEAGMAAARHEAEEKGRQEGRQEGLAEMLLRQLTIKFGPQAAGVAKRLAGASQAELVRWSERVLSADGIDAVFA